MAFFKKEQSDSQWLVVFLGNPGQKYENTRHNVGFMTADALERDKGIKIKRLRFQSLTGTCRFGQEQAFLMKPQTYMNLSGDAVKEAQGFYKTPADRVLVISDDVSIPLGTLRVKRKGSAGGHNGLKDIIRVLGTDQFPRIKIGIGAPDHPDYDMVDWVIGSFTKSERATINDAAERATQAIETIICRGVDPAMNQFN